MNPWETVNLINALAVAAGATVGALARWLAGVALAGQGPGFPLATALVNLVGGALIGLTLAAFSRHPSEVLRLLLVTGFLGGFTTFSAYSAESLTLIERGAWGTALAHTALHVLGALACTAIGLRIGRIWWGA